MKARGALIVFEGLDRSGKSTQAKLLYEALLELTMKSDLWKYPNRTTNIGKLINEYLTNQKELNDHAIHLLFSSNRWETIDEMKKKLNSGINIIVDRYAYSGVAYTAAKKDMDFEWCKQSDKGLPKPDIVFFMDTSADVASTRDAYGNERYEKTEFQKLVYNNFCKFFPSQGDDSNFCIINANETIEVIHSKIFQKSLNVIEKCKQTDMQSLW